MVGAVGFSALTFFAEAFLAGCFDGNGRLGVSWEGGVFGFLLQRSTRAGERSYGIAPAKHPIQPNTHESQKMAPRASYGLP